MSAPRGEPQREGSFPIGLAAGLALGFVLSSVLVGALGYLYMKRRDRERSLAYEVPVIIALQDLPAGSLITYDVLGQRAMPQRFITASVVKPDSASFIINKPLLVPVLAGDMLLWSQFEVQQPSPLPSPEGRGGRPAEVR